MNRFIAIGFVALCGMTSACYAQPKLEIVGGDTKDWGKVKPADSPLQTKIVFKNTGSEVLKLTSVKAGCGCTTTKESKSEIAPGDTASVQVSLNVGTVTGAVHKNITITSNDPAKGTVMYNLKAEVYRPLQFRPTQYISFTDMKIGNKSNAKVTLTNASDKDITLNSIELPAGLKINLKNNTAIKAGSELEISADIVPDKEGYYSQVIKMKTTHPDYPTLEIPVYGNVMKSTSPLYLKSDNK